MIDSVMIWFQDNTNSATFINIITILLDLEKVGYKFEHLIEIIRKFIEDNLEDCMEIIHVNFELNLQTMIDILLYNGPLLKECIRMFNSNIRQEKEYEYLIVKLENVS